MVRVLVLLYSSRIRQGPPVTQSSGLNQEPVLTQPLVRSKVSETTLLLVPAIKDFCTLSSFSATKTLKLIKVPANKAWFTVYKKMEKLLGLPLMVALFLMLVIPPPICSLRLMVTGYVLMSKCQWPKWKFTGQTNCEISLDKSAQLEGKNIIKVQWRAGVLQHHQWRTGQGRQCQRGASGLAPCHVVFSSNYKCTCKVQVHMYKVQVHVQNTST